MSLPSGSRAYEFFPRQELMCKCGCEKSAMDPRFMEKLIKIRRDIGIPLTLTSAYRCPAHNERVSSTGLKGPHTTGRAVDIAANSSLKYKIMLKASKYGFTRFGVAKNFIHIDDLAPSDDFPDQVVWSY